MNLDYCPHTSCTAHTAISIFGNGNSMCRTGNALEYSVDKQTYYAAVVANHKEHTR
jgi:hypothetical protein